MFSYPALNVKTIGISVVLISKEQPATGSEGVQAALPNRTVYSDRNDQHVLFSMVATSHVCLLST